MTRDVIEIRGLALDCVVGIRPEEREREQPVRLDLSLGLDLSSAGRSGRIAETCDYDRVADEVIALLRFRRYRLIEGAVEEVAAMLLGVHAPLVRVRVRSGARRWSGDRRSTGLRRGHGPRAARPARAA